MLDKARQEGRTRILNPAYTAVSRQGIMKLLYDMFPESPYLLHRFCAFGRSSRSTKKLFGRERCQHGVLCR